MSFNSCPSQRRRPKKSAKNHLSNYKPCSLKPTREDDGDDGDDGDSSSDEEVESMVAEYVKKIFTY
jgi:hypothetical protein